MRLSGRPLYHLHRRGVKKKELTTHRPIVLAQRIQVKMLQIWRRAESGHSPEPVSHPVRDSLPSASRCPIPSSRATPAPLQGDVRPFMTYVPFSTSDLYNGKLQNPSFSEKPQALISLLETLFVTQQPTWDDCQQLLQVLFTTEERDKIRREARKLVMGPNGQPTEDPAGFKEVFPSSHPENWDPNAPHECLSATREPLSLLQKLGYRVSARKAQICRTAVTYLSYNLKKDPDISMFSGGSSFVFQGQRHAGRCSDDGPRGFMATDPSPGNFSPARRAHHANKSPQTRKKQASSYLYGQPLCFLQPRMYTDPFTKSAVSSRRKARPSKLKLKF
ncbi:uncharacterized protein LOC102968023 isoform X1 [Panthera tigris]|uniref:uncharacterized protein LOC102968023 isoform X1 n=1 Tax=Panthera tigris TaxID=9694 RepID=UPI001C6FA815|nr:uncharacterized protein LOC102968023 isoform X1 [Panthera tigris]XP_042825865.1 uncharacterized protein LOC102968023 isoform X1 [Panthera tigris]XP_042825866.1 uncharacterized protein LOC102968023 isoform X1 [Panthera tigris]XP_042825867.1 uncharacterized protein LOC102968023 isoform X1 [Panthera tigris]